MSKIRQIVQLFFEDDHPTETKQKFYRWFLAPISESEKEKALFEQWNRIESIADPSTKDSFNEVIARFGVDKRKQRLRVTPKLIRIAAVLLIPIITSLAAYLYVKNSETQSVEFVEYFTPNANLRTIDLPDGSSVTMNYGSIIVYPRNFTAKRREVFLSGEAKFTVSHDKKRPFIVKTNDMNIEALGTIFNVSSYVENSETIATLVDGKVRIDMKNSEENFILEPSQQIVLDRETGKTFIRQAKLELELAWEKGYLSFQNADIEDIMQEIQRKYDVRIYANYKEIKGEKLTVKFTPDESLYEIFKTIQLLINRFNYRIEGDNIYIY
ncbi:FecR family protein [uncultured Proteiniphilum sp.]|uniref:FecR family protein n=1 Tax=uncultured Proteiniphilum sp. TaxID=497637 RepID=UPI0026331B85|nr:FecR family protein [uncultured Proteiniphilum sp.]